MDRHANSAEAYRNLLQEQRCKIIAEHHSVEKERVEFVFRMPRRCSRVQVETAARNIAAELRGDVDWEIS
jgi:uncharacterized protein YicC (UPF0701 family)